MFFDLRLTSGLPTSFKPRQVFNLKGCVLTDNLTIGNRVRGNQHACDKNQRENEKQLFGPMRHIFFSCSIGLQACVVKSARRSDRASRAHLKTRSAQVYWKN